MCSARRPKSVSPHACWLRHCGDNVALNGCRKGGRVTSSEHVAAYNELLSRAAQKALDYLAALPDRPPLVPDCDSELRQRMGGALPVSPTPSREVLELLLKGADLGICPSGSSRYFGYVTGGALPVTLAADWLVSVWDQACSVYELSPLTSVLEDVCREWLVGLFGLPHGTSVSFTPACTYASLLGLTAARHKVLSDCGWDVATEGMNGAPPVTVLVNDAIHASVRRPLHILGLGGGIRELATDGHGRITPKALAAGLDGAAGSPVIVCGHVGEVNTGAVDDLYRLGHSVRAAGGWLHLDAAFGMWAAATGRRHTLLRGLELADSWATDAHKWLNVPYDCGIALIADAGAHRAALAAAPDYLNHGNAQQRHPMQWELGFARRSRVIPVWAALRQLGRDGVAQLVDRHCALARRLAARLAAEPGVHVVNEVVLNQVAVWFEHPGRDQDTHTRQVADAFQRHGEAWASTSRWNGHVIVRLSVVNWLTCDQDIDRAAGSLITCHHTLVEEGVPPHRQAGAGPGGPGGSGTAQPAADLSPRTAAGAGTSEDFRYADARACGLPLSREDAERVEDAARQLAAEHRGSSLHDRELLQAVELRAAALPVPVRRALIAFRDEGNASGFVLLTGLPVGSLPDTPERAEDEPEWQHVAVATLSQLMVMSVLGRSISYSDEKHGCLVQDVWPKKGANRQENSGSVRLALHTEDGFHPAPPHFVGLLCLRGDRDGAAALVTCGIGDVLPELDAATVAALRRPEFRIRFSTSFVPDASAKVLTDPMPVLSGPAASPDLRCDFNGSVAVTPRAQAALDRLEQVMRRSLKGLVTQPGDLIILDNRRAMHGRTGFTPRYDRRDRWLRRTFAVADLRPVIGDLGDGRRCKPGRGRRRTAASPDVWFSYGAGYRATARCLPAPCRGRREGRG